VEDVARHLGGGGFPRLRFGIGRPPPGMDAVRYVLEPFSAEERALLPAAVDAAAQALAAALREGVAVAMGRVNRVGSAGAPEEEEGPPA
jgi:PTH1 family peptidyl-tRNA hydrolase